MGDNMRAILNVFPYNSTSNCVVSGQEIVISGHLAMEIMPLEVSAAKSDKNRRHLWSKKPGLGLERCALVSPKRTGSSKA
jgi:hypothetical protein